MVKWQFQSFTSAILDSDDSFFSQIESLDVPLPPGTPVTARELSAALVRGLKGRTIVFLGDSMATQSFQAFTCFLHSTLNVRSTARCSRP